MDLLSNLIALVHFFLANTTYSDQVQQVLQSDFLKTGMAQLHQNILHTLSYNVNFKTARIVLLAAGIIILFGVVGESFFRRTGMPDVPLLMGLGILLGPIFGLVNTHTITYIVPYFTALALILIMFDGGLSLNVKEIRNTARFSFPLSILSLVFSIVVVALIAFYGLHWQWINSVLLGAIVGGSGSVVVFSLIKKLTLSDQTRTMIGLDTGLANSLGIVVVYIIINSISSGSLNPNEVWIEATKYLVSGVAIGFGVGIPWMYVESRLGNAKHGYMLTIGMLFVIFFLARTFGESGALTALVFGIILGNKEFFSRRFKIKLPEIAQKESFHDELVFLVRIFFFVLIGLLFNFGQFGYVIFGVLMAIAIYLVRVCITKAVVPKRFPTFDRHVISVMMPRGLSAAVMATVPLIRGLPDASMYPQIVFIIIISSIVITTVGISRAKKKVSVDLH